MGETSKDRHGLARLIPWLPVMGLATSVLVTATAAQFQINANTTGLAKLADDLTKRVPTFLYERWQADVEKDLTKLAGNIETNEEVLQQVERGTDKIDSRIELEVERLRNQIERNEQAQSIKLDAIIQKLETLEGN